MGHRAHIGLVAALVSSTASAQECFTDAHADEVEAVLIEADAAWAAGEHDEFRAAVQEARAFVLPCLVEVLRPDVAAHLHRVQALAAFLDPERALAAAAMQAARALDPERPLDEALLPAGHELRLAYEAPPTPAARRRLPPPAEGTVWIDGTATLDRPEDRPAVAQVAWPDGRYTSAWLAPADPMLAYPVRPRLRTGLAVGSGVAAAVFGGLFGGAHAARSAYYGADPADGATLDRLRATTNGLGGASLAAGAAAVGLAVGAIAVGPR